MPITEPQPQMDSELTAELQPLQGLQGVMAWMARRRVSLAAVNIVQQDEFSLDFVVPLADGRFVVFAIT